MKRLLAGILTVVLLGVMLWSGSRRESTNPVEVAASSPVARTPTVEPDPAEARVNELLLSAATGDVTGYLDAFTGELRDRLARQISERGRERFADDLRNAARARKSHAVFAAEPDGPVAALVTVESVYPDRNERRTYHVERVDEGWRVARVETVKSHQPRATFGTPASYIAPEGPPVSVGVAVETGDDPEPN